MGVHIIHGVGGYGSKPSCAARAAVQGLHFKLYSAKVGLQGSRFKGGISAQGGASFSMDPMHGWLGPVLLAWISSFPIDCVGCVGKARCAVLGSSKRVNNSVDMGLGCAAESWSLAQKVWFAC